MSGGNATHVEFKDVCKTYDGRTLAVSHLDLTVASGEFVTFLGPSGSGKTTSLMMLAGFETETSGEILIAGRSMSRVAPHRRNIGMVFQNYALFPHMTVAENIAFPLSVRGVPAAEQASRVGRVLERVRLGAYGARRPSELSGGQQQRVALARALVFDPVLILMDEPLGALDKQLRDQLQLEIKHLHAELGVTIIYVTHDQSEALTMSDRVAVFNDGSIQQIASPSHLYRFPATPFVAGFVGENNQFSCTVTAVEGDTWTLASPAGDPLRAVGIGSCEVGRSVPVSVRPEHLIVRPRDDMRMIDARLEEAIYHGDHTRLRFRTGWGDVVTAKVMRPDELGPLPIGESMPLGWRPEDCRAFAA
ncbi:ABC transporter ATP-binding protein [Enterovirga rhinocerotis]|uniref:Putative spermidine/putrescine transport system ATP-binding protein n=1 Tax=Enterovirga rhinocerotis TaxID=1339210 RepID=A0A4R7C899_9HYPH|nr:ABC transporter ATP-binding protein [Enterovirga rhinocerotis]TDR92947.1 putative spermidine/putrescine transport system ATP-binding protein [Enterovirga rhinocerotis]